MDEIAAFRCAIRSGCNVRKPSDVTDKMKVKMAGKKSLDVAKYILVECHLRTYDVDEEDGEQHSFVKLLHELAYGLIPASNLKEWAWISLFPEGTNFVSKYSEKLGEEYAEYLTQCFTDANTGYERYIVDAGGECLDEYEIPDWLAQAFNLRQDANAGQPIDLERDADVLDGMEYVFAAMTEQSDSHTSKLEEDLQHFILGESSQFPQCIDRLIRLKGYPQAAEYMPTIRNELAEWIPKEIERVRKTIKGKVKSNRMIAANIFTRCSDKCVDQADLLLARSDISDADKDRLRDKREVLRDYGSESLQSNNKSGNATGFERIFRDHKDKIHSTIKRSPNVRSVEELEDMAMQRKKKKARSNSAVRKAIRIIKSPDVGNQNRAELLKLQKQTPKDAQIVWPDLWDEFGQALVRVAAEQNESQSPA